MVTIGSGEQFLVEYEQCMYAGLYDEAVLRDEMESRAYDALRDSNISIRDIDRALQALTAELMCMQLSDNVEPVKVTWLGE